MKLTNFTIAQLDACIGEPQPMVRLKTIDHLDVGALEWIAASTMMTATFASGEDISLTIASGEPGWGLGTATELRLRRTAMDDPDIAQTGSSFGGCFMIKPLNEVLRVNGQVTAAYSDTVVIAVHECYLHCGKAMLRSDFWNSGSNSEPGAQLELLIGRCRFMALGTVDNDGGADVSPRGDPAGSMLQLHDGIVWFADRPGNRKIDSLRNIMSQPRIAALAVIPGSSFAVRMSGSAFLSDDPMLRKQFAVRDKLPALVVGVQDIQIKIVRSAALHRVFAAQARSISNIRPAVIGIGHIKLNKSVEAQAAAALPAPELVEEKMKLDYANNLY